MTTRYAVTTWSNRAGDEDLRAGIWMLEADSALRARQTPGSPDAVFWGARDPSDGTLLLLRNADPGSALLRWDPARGEVLANVPEGAQGGCHLSLTADARRLLVTAPPGGWSLFANGADAPRLLAQHAGSGSGPHPRQERSHPHCAILSPGGDVVLTADLGTDEVLALPLTGDPAAGFGPARVLHRTAPGSGPRQLVAGDGVLHILCELSSTLETVRLEADGTATLLARIPTVPAGFAGETWAAHLSATADGRRLYATNRGHDSIAILDVDDQGVPHLREIVPSGGAWPWACHLDEDRGELLVANNRSDEITRFRVAEDGSLAQEDAVAVRSPACLIPLP